MSINRSAYYFRVVVGVHCSHVVYGDCALIMNQDEQTHDYCNTACITVSQAFVNMHLVHVFLTHAEKESIAELF